MRNKQKSQKDGPCVNDTLLLTSGGCHTVTVMFTSIPTTYYIPLGPWCSQARKRFMRSMVPFWFAFIMPYQKNLIRPDFVHPIKNGEQKKNANVWCQICQFLCMSNFQAQNHKFAYNQLQEKFLRRVRTDFISCHQHIRGGGPPPRQKGLWLTRATPGHFY